MDLTLRFLGLALVFSFGLDQTGESAEAYHVGTTDHTFGFAPDAVFAPRYWTEEEE